MICQVCEERRSASANAAQWIGGKKVFRLVHDQARRLAAEFCMIAPDGWIARFSESTRTLDQNSKFHAICGDIAKSGIEFAGKKRTDNQWKVLLVSGHAVATGEEAEIIPGLENEFVNIRESTALMSVKRGASLIEYSLAWCAANGVRINDAS
jgi:hypothetical protein